MERKFNDKVPEVLKKHRLMGVPISKKYGGDGARPLVHSLTLERFGQLGLGVVTFVDVHQALGSLTLQEWGNEEQKQRYLTKAATGEVDPRLRAHRARGRQRPRLAEDAVQEGREQLLPHRLEIPDLERLHREQADSLRLPGRADEGDDGLPGRRQGDTGSPST